MDDQELKFVRHHLGEHLSRGEVALFTGAGFSYGVTDLAGRPIPQVDDLRDEITQLVWPDEPIDRDSTLRDTFAAALHEGRNKLARHLRERLHVDPESVGDGHRLWLSMPWARAYTINIDDLETAGARQFSLPRTIHSHSAISGGPPGGTTSSLVFVHLNGTLEDIPDVTFTDPQYGLRHGGSNPLYEQLAAELLAYPIVFVGSTLRESLFWEYLTMRDQRGARGVNEMRPLSYLVTPSLPPDRRRLLSTYNIRWVPLTTEQFADSVLAHLTDEAESGLRTLRSLSPGANSVDPAKVMDLAAITNAQASDYLLGARPRWDDIRGGRAVVRDFESEVIAPPTGTLVVTGTAGAGTSTTLMRLALRLVAENREVRWIAADQEFEPRALGRWLREFKEGLVLVIDDADTFGRSLPLLVEDAKASLGDVLLVLGLRSSRLDGVLPGWAPNDEDRVEIVVPPLGDNDIERLLDVLESNNRLGVLKPLPYLERVSRIRHECGRELLVAMYEATSGERFEYKVAEEFDKLEAEQRIIYAITAIASDLRSYLLRDELLMASGDISNTALYAVDRLAARRLLLEDNARYTLRHRRIAELVVARLRNSAEMLTPYRGLLRTMATKHGPRRPRSRERRLFSSLLSHQRIGNTFEIEDARSLYQEVEELCRDDYHYWLQRGSFEVQFGSLALARTWLSHAKAGGDHDRRVHTEWAYYLIKSAYRQPAATDAKARVAEAQAILFEYMAVSGDADVYAWHVYGSQMLGWIKVAPMSGDERAALLREVIDRTRDGVEKHPKDNELRVLLADLERELLLLAVPAKRSP
jgi:hypothetical protein